MQAASAAAKTATGVGVIRAVDPKTGMVTIQHEPIPAIGWARHDDVVQARLARGDARRQGRAEVVFGVRVSGSAAEVTSIKPR